MFMPAQYYLAEANYRRELLARDWSRANRRRRVKDRRRGLRLPKRPVLKLPQRKSGDVVVA